MIIIRHRSGPLAGRRQGLDGKSGRIVFGRDPDACDVVFPPDLTIVARRHFAIARSPAGEWVIELFGDPFVAIDGEPADLGEAVHSGAKIELGKHGGPSFELELHAEGLAGNLPVTEPQEKVEDAHAFGDRMGAIAIWIVGLSISGAIGGLIGIQFNADYGGWVGIAAGMFGFTWFLLWLGVPSHRTYES